MKPLLNLEIFYWLGGALFASMAWQAATNRRQRRRWGSGAFWGLLAVITLLGPVLPPVAVGYLVLGMVALAAMGQVVPAEVQVASRGEREASAARLQNRLFWPALLVPLTAVVGSLGLSHVPADWSAWIDLKQGTLMALGCGALLALAAAVCTTGAAWRVPVAEGSRLLQAVGWALLLPPLLAALGGLFAKAGVGAVVAELVGRALPTQFPLVAVAAYCLGMALFTICLGNAFAAFAVITGGIGLPLVVQLHHGNPAIMAGIGMLSGYCGTLLTPMAANFNLVPAMLLELKDRHAVIKAQVPIGLTVLAANIAIMYFCVYRF